MTQPEQKVPGWRLLLTGAALLMTSLSFGGPVVLAQGAAGQSATDPIVERLDVRVVNVDVVVTNKKGDPIQGLTASDFELMEDGQTVEISNFFSYGDDGLTAGAGKASDSGSGADVAGAADPLILAIYLDDNNLPPFARKRVVQDLAPVLEDWADDNTQFVFVRRSNSISFDVGPTSDPQDVVQAIQEPPKTNRGVESKLEFDRGLAALEQEYVGCANARFCDPCTTGWQSLVQVSRRFADEQTARVVDAASGLADVVSVLAGVPGRKAVLYVTEGLPQTPGLGIFTMLPDLCPNQETNANQQLLGVDETSRLNALAAHANANRVMLYTLDAGGLRGGSAADASRGGAPSLGGTGSSGDLPSFVPSSRVDQARISNLQNSLFQLADETGGKAILNANRPGADLVRLKDDFTSTYSLGFEPGRPPTGRIHLLDVRFKNGRKGKLRYRRSYRDKLEEELLGERLLSKLYLSNSDRTMEAKNPMRISLSIGGAEKVSRRMDSVPVEIRMPRSALTVIPGGAPEARVAQLRIWMTALGSRGHLPVRQEVIDFTADDPRLEQDFISIVVDMELRREDQRIAVGVRDETSSESSLVVVSLGFDKSNS